MKTGSIFAAFVLMWLCGQEVSAWAQNNPGWKLVWSDEFDQADGSAPDPAKWGYDTGGTGWGNNELEYYTSRTNNARIQNGQLLIEARQESFGGRNYTSARLLTKGKWSWTYGRIEARIRIPRGQGIWPAFWTLGSDVDSAGWPTCGEIDIMENIGSEPGTVHGTAHGPGYSGSGGIGGPFVLPGGAAFADDFHLFAIEWATNRIQWFVDGHPYFSVSPSSLPGTSTWIFTAPQFLLLNVAVGGNWPGSPNASTSFPQQMLVDYVRVYALTNGPACGANILSNPGFETGGLANWTAYPGGANTGIQDVTAAPVHGGSNGFKIYGQFNGAVNYSGAYQDRPASPGDTFAANGWALTRANDRIAGGNTAWLEVSFRDSVANLIALYRSAVIDTNTTPGVWLNLPVTNQFDPITFAFLGSVSNLAAPAGTVFVREQVVFRQPATANGSVLFDDLSLFSPAGGEIPLPVAIGKSGANVNLRFDTLLGVPYQVRYKNVLTDSAWQVLTNVTGTGFTLSPGDATGLQRRFYQVTAACN